MTTTTSATERGDMVGQVAHWDREAKKWAAEAADNRRAAASLRTDVSAAVLADPAGGSSVTSRARELDDAAACSASAAASAQAKAAEAWAEVLEHDAKR